MYNKIKPTLDNYCNLLGENDSKFLKRIYDKDQEIYKIRLRNIGFSGKKNILDAGCGFGQWSLALSHLNEKISSIDIQSERLFVLNDLMHLLGIKNINIKRGNLIKLPYENNTFDAVFCYGVIFCTDWKKAIKEFHRILKPGGVLYFTANEIGWYLKLWFEQYNKTSDYSPRELAAETLLNTVNYNKHGILLNKGQIIISQKDCEQFLIDAGFESIRMAGEGKIMIPDEKLSVAPFFDEFFKDNVACYEVLSQKNNAK